MSLRTKAIVLSVLVIIISLILQTVDLSSTISFTQEIAKALLVAGVFLVGLYWVLGFKIKGIRLLTILGYSSYIVFIQALFIELVIFQSEGRISERTFSLLVLFFFGISIYLLILTMNILNISYISKIPLAQAAKAANFLFTLFGAYFSFLLILRSGVFVVIKLIVFSFVVFLLTLNIFWFKKESARQLFGETVAVVLSIATAFVIFIIWPLSVEVATMFYVIVYYIFLSLGLEEKETTSTAMRVEYMILLFLAVFLLLKLAVWGINGAFI
ncbi:hypothetical protein JW766_02735 [Candidatus Dojkabacteria bacterium]|nr:hypothetical protein [Candidatus Dojkabacteria bacterium]